MFGFFSSGAAYPGVASDGQDPGGMIAAGNVSTALAFQVIDPDTRDILETFDANGLIASSAITLVNGSLEVQDINNQTHFGVAVDGSIHGGSDVDGSKYQINGDGSATFESVETLGILYLPNGHIDSTPVSLTASLANQQAQIDQIVSLLVDWGVVVDNRVP